MKEPKKKFKYFSKPFPVYREVWLGHFLGSTILTSGSEIAAWIKKNFPKVEIWSCSGGKLEPFLETGVGQFLEGWVEATDEILPRYFKKDGEWDFEESVRRGDVHPDYLIPTRGRLDSFLNFALCVVDIPPPRGRAHLVASCHEALRTFAEIGKLIAKQDRHEWEMWFHNMYHFTQYITHGKFVRTEFLEDIQELYKTAYSSGYSSRCLEIATEHLLEWVPKKKFAEFGLTMDHATYRGVVRS